MAGQNVVHALEPDVVEAGDDLGVDLLQHFEAVTRPLDENTPPWRRSYGLAWEVFGAAARRAMVASKG